MTSVKPDWDGKLSPDSLKGLSNVERRRRARASLERKVEILEQHRKTSTPFPGDLPRTRHMLRSWVDPELKLRDWFYPGVDDPNGKNGDLMARYLVSVRALDALARKGRPSGRTDMATILEQNRRFAEEIAILKSENLQILKQNARLTDLNNKMKRSMQQ